MTIRDKQVSFAKVWGEFSCKEIYDRLGYNSGSYIPEYITVESSEIVDVDDDGKHCIIEDIEFRLFCGHTRDEDDIWKIFTDRGIPPCHICAFHCDFEAELCIMVEEKVWYGETIVLDLKIPDKDDGIFEASLTGLPKFHSGGVVPSGPRQWYDAYINPNLPTEDNIGQGHYDHMTDSIINQIRPRFTSVDHIYVEKGLYKYTRKWWEKIPILRTIIRKLTKRPRIHVMKATFIEELAGKFKKKEIILPRNQGKSFLRDDTIDALDTLFKTKDQIRDLK